MYGIQCLCDIALFSLSFTHACFENITKSGMRFDYWHEIFLLKPNSAKWGRCFFEDAYSSRLIDIGLPIDRPLAGLDFLVILICNSTFGDLCCWIKWSFPNGGLVNSTISPGQITTSRGVKELEVFIAKLRVVVNNYVLTGHGVALLAKF